MTLGGDGRRRLADGSLTGGCLDAETATASNRRRIDRDSQSVTSKMTDVSVLFVCLGNICMWQISGITMTRSMMDG